MPTRPTKTKKTGPRVDSERVRVALQSLNVQTVRGLTPQRLLAHLESFDLGYLRGAAQLWQKIKDRCDTTKSVAEKRELDAALLDYEILTIDDSPEAVRHKKALEAAYNGLVAVDALDQDQRGGVSLLIRQMMHSVGHRKAVHEIVWDPSGADLTAEFRFTPLQFFESTVGRLRFLAREGDAIGSDLEEGGWMVTTGAGLMEATSIAYLFKTLPLKSWLVFCDKCNTPLLHGQTDAQRGSDEWNRFRDALASAGEDWALITNLAAKITAIDLKAGGQLPHPGLVDRMDRAITRLWRGADLGTMSRDGQAVGSNPQDAEAGNLTVADALRVSEALNYYFDRWVIRYRFGAEPLAYFKLKPPVKVDQKLEIAIDSALIGWGCGRSKKDLLERYGRPQPDKGDELASMPAAPAFGAGPAALANEAAAIGRDAIFKAHAAAQELAARRPVYRPIAERLAAMYAASDSASLLAATRQLQADAHTLYRGVVDAAPELARPTQEAMGTALISGFAEAAKARPKPAKPTS